MKPTLYLKRLVYYTAIKFDCDERPNLGLIGVGGQNGAQGMLDVKEDFCDLIQQQGGNFQQLPGFVLSPNGRTHFGNGAGFLGWKNFGSQDAVIQYLMQYFNLVECDEDGAISFEEMIHGVSPGDKLMETLLWRGFAVVPHQDGLLLHECSHEKDVATLQACGLDVQRFERPGVGHRFWIPPQPTPDFLLSEIFGLAACNGMVGSPQNDESFASFKTINHDAELYVEGLDAGIALLVKGLNLAGVYTVMSCDGHEKQPPQIWLRTRWDYLWCQHVLHQVWPIARHRHPWVGIHTIEPVPRPISAIWNFVDDPTNGWLRYFFTWEWPRHDQDGAGQTSRLIQAYARELLCEDTSSFLRRQKAGIGCERELLDLVSLTESRNGTPESLGEALLSACGQASGGEAVDRLLRSILREGVNQAL